MFTEFAIKQNMTGLFNAKGLDKHFFVSFEKEQPDVLQEDQNSVCKVDVSSNGSLLQAQLKAS